jgi:hypothetical protein
VIQGASSKDFFGTAYAQNDKGFEGFKFGDANIQLDDTLLLIEPGVAKQYEDSLKAKAEQPKPAPTTIPQPSFGNGGNKSVVLPPIGPVQPPKFRQFHGSVEINPTKAKMELSQISDEIIKLLASDPNATVLVNLEISADFPNGVTEQTKRAVSENASSLKFQNKDWE